MRFCRIFAKEAIEMKSETRLGLLLFVVSLALRSYLPTAFMLQGAVLGMALCMLILGLVPDDKLKTARKFKKSIIGSLSKK
jgi:hypothetical protein